MFGRALRAAPRGSVRLRGRKKSDSGAAVSHAASGALAAVAVAVSSSASRSAGGDITPSLVVEYVDTSGVRQTTTVVSGVTSISLQRYTSMHFDAGATRSVVATTERDAWEAVGYRINYGEAIGTNWTYGGGASRDEDTGPPIFGHTFTVVGTHTVRLRCKDASANEATVSFTVVVSALPTATHILVSAGAWPAWASNTHYTLDGGGDYTGFGTLQTHDRHNIVITKVGGGADPRIATFSPSNYGQAQLDAGVITRPKNIRLVDIDANEFRAGIVGFDFCTMVRGRCRTFTHEPLYYYYPAVSTDTEHTNCRYPRGVFLHDAGEMTNTDGGLSDYVMIFNLRQFHAKGVLFHRNAGADLNHNLRNVLKDSSHRYCNIYSSVSTGHPIKGQAMDVSAGDGQPDVWAASTDYAGTISGAERLYGFPNSRVVHHRCQLGRSGDVVPSYQLDSQPQSPTAGPDEGHEYVAFEDSSFYWTSYPAGATRLGGRYMSCRNVRLNLGAGSHIGVSGSRNTENIPPGWDGPYLDEATNTRPVPTAF